MLSIVVAVRNNRRFVSLCLASLAKAVAATGVAAEYILIDDQSEPDQDLRGLFGGFAAQAAPGHPIRAFHFLEHQHYTRALAYGFSAARGSRVLFVSHDMLVTPQWISTLLEVADANPGLGIVRGVANYVDGCPEYSISPPLPMRDFADLDAFATYIRTYFALTMQPDRFLVGDGMLISRELIDRIGTFDPRYYGYFGDTDFGIRTLRAGFGLGCARGAWLWHDGEGFYKDRSKRTGLDEATVHQQRMAVVGAAYQLFRAKWDPALPPEYPGFHALDFDRLRAGPAPAGGDYQPLIEPAARICEIRALA